MSNQCQGNILGFMYTLNPKMKLVLKLGYGRFLRDMT